MPPVSDIIWEWSTRARIAHYVGDNLTRQKAPFNDDDDADMHNLQTATLHTAIHCAPIKSGPQNK